MLAIGVFDANILAGRTALGGKVLFNRHSGASIGTAFAGCSACFAVFHVVFAAFCCTSLANFRAEGAHVVGVCVATCDSCRSQLTKISAGHVGSYASSHRFGVILFNASACTLQTSNGALVARADAISFFLAKHVDSLKLPKIGKIHFEIGAVRWL